MARMSRIPVHEKPQSSQKCPWLLKVMLGLACPKVWDKKMQARGKRKMPDPHDKRNRKMDYGVDRVVVWLSVLFVVGLVVLSMISL